MLPPSYDNQILNLINEVEHYRVQFQIQFINNQTLQKELDIAEAKISKQEQVIKDYEIAEEIMSKQLLNLSGENQKNISDRENYISQLEQEKEQRENYISQLEQVVVQRKTSRELKNIGDFNNAPKRRRNN